MTDLYELSVGNSRRVLESTIAVMEKGASYFKGQGIDLAEIIDMRLANQRCTVRENGLSRQHEHGIV